MKRILITGVHGFVGSNLVQALKSDYEIYGLDIVAPEKDGVVKTFSWRDFDNGLIPDTDAIIHLAGKAHDTDNRSEADAYYAVNTGLTKKVFDYFSFRSDIKKFIFFSSVKAAAEKVPGEILYEDVRPCPVGPYGESKLKAENYIRERLSDESDMYGSKEVIILRPCMIHGPGNKGNLNLLYRFVEKGLPWPLGAFENRRSFTTMGNLSYVINGLLSESVESGIYNMADDAALPVNELIENMCSAMGRKPRIICLNKKFVKIMAKIGDMLHLPLNTFRLNKLTEDYVVSNVKLKKALGITRMPFDAKDGLAETIRSFKKRQ